MLFSWEHVRVMFSPPRIGSQGRFLNFPGGVDCRFADGERRAGWAESIQIGRDGGIPIATSNYRDRLPKV